MWVAANPPLGRQKPGWDTQPPPTVTDTIHGKPKSQPETSVRRFSQRDRGGCVAATRIPSTPRERGAAAVGAAPGRPSTEARHTSGPVRTSRGLLPAAA